MAEYRKGAHTVHDIKYHFVWVTKYRYQVLRGEVAERTRDLIRQVCMAREITILKGHVSRDHVHLYVSATPNLSPARIMQYVKGKLQGSRRRTMDSSRRRPFAKRPHDVSESTIAIATEQRFL